jgi:hypothetical protein
MVKPFTGHPSVHSHNSIKYLSLILDVFKNGLMVVLLENTEHFSVCFSKWPLFFYRLLWFMLCLSFFMKLLTRLPYA